MQSLFMGIDCLKRKPKLMTMICIWRYCQKYYAFRWHSPSLIEPMTFIFVSDCQNGEVLLKKQVNFPSVWLIEIYQYLKKYPREISKNIDV